MIYGARRHIAITLFCCGQDDFAFDVELPRVCLSPPCLSPPLIKEKPFCGNLVERTRTIDHADMQQVEHELGKGGVDKGGRVDLVHSDMVAELHEGLVDEAIPT